MITCCNNAGTCCLFLSRWEETYKFAKNALVLIDALYEKREKSKILKIISSEGMELSKLFGTWKVKSLLLIARALAEKYETEDAITNLKVAQGIVTFYKKKEEEEEEGNPIIYQQLTLQEKQIRRLFTSCKQRIIAERKKEKQRAKAMFNIGGSGKSLLVETKSSSKEKEEKEEEEEEEKEEMTNAPSSKKNEVKATTTIAAPNTDSPQHRKRVSFVDGTKPGNLLGYDDDDDNEQVLSFFNEHIEALILLTGGVVVGSFLFSYLKKR